MKTRRQQLRRSPAPASGIIEILFLSKFLIDALKTYKATNPDDLVKEANQRLDAINLQLAALRESMDEVLDRLRKLPEMIRGEIRREALEEWLSTAEVATLEIQWHLSDDKERLSENIKDIKRLREDLTVSIKQVLRLSRSSDKKPTLTGIFAATPFIGTWAEALAVVERFQGGKRSPQEHPFSTLLRYEYASFFSFAVGELDRSKEFLNGIVMPVTEDPENPRPVFQFTGTGFIPFPNKRFPYREDYAEQDQYQLPGNVFVTQKFGRDSQGKLHCLRHDTKRKLLTWYKFPESQQEWTLARCLGQYRQDILPAFDTLLREKVLHDAVVRLLKYVPDIRGPVLRALGAIGVDSQKSGTRKMQD